MRSKSTSKFVTAFLAFALLSSTANAGPVCDLIGKGLDKLGKKVYNCARKVEQLKPKGELIKKAKRSCKAKFSKARGKCGC